MEDSKAEAKKAMESQYDVVPGFAQRRGWHGSNVNQHNYAEAINPNDAVFACNKLKPGKMAELLARPPSPTSSDPMEPRGRARTNGGGGIGPEVKYYE